MTKLYGAIEAGGTKFICAVGTGPENVINQKRIPTTSPEETLSRCLEFFQSQDSVVALGVGSFGPLDLSPQSPSYGAMTGTPKSGWADVNIRAFFSTKLNVPVMVDTDVNGAALAEALWGAGRGLKNVVYFTIGTGVGAGVLVDGKLVHGSGHPEVGHLIIRRDPRDTFEGICKFHKDCLEGMASGPAIKARWGIEASALDSNPEALDIIGYYIAQGVVATSLTCCPEKIILGGGVMDQKELFKVVRSWTSKLLNGYLVGKTFDADLENYITAPAVEIIPSGLAGAFALAMGK